MRLLTLVSVLVCVGLSTQQTDFCSPSLCSYGLQHIACDGLIELSPDCEDGAQEFSLSWEEQAYILELHNSYRNWVALGYQEYETDAYYPQAARMPTMNIATYWFYGQTYTVQELISIMFTEWYDEYQHANPSVIASFPGSWTGPEIGHFTQIVSDRSAYVGCAMVRLTEAEYTMDYLVCNYGFSNYHDQPVYVEGTPCSECTTGCNDEYPGLCSIYEEVVPMP